MINATRMIGYGSKQCGAVLLSRTVFDGMHSLKLFSRAQQTQPRHVMAQICGGNASIRTWLSVNAGTNMHTALIVKT